MIEYLVSEEGSEITVLELRRSVVLTIDGKEVTLSRDTADTLVELLHECPVPDDDYDDY